MDHAHHQHHPDRSVSIVLDVTGIRRATEKATVEALLGRLPGVLTVEANPRVADRHREL